MLVIDIAKDPIPTEPLDFTSWTGSGPAVVITNSSPIPYDSRLHVIKGLRISGPAVGLNPSNTIGVLLENAAGISLQDCVIHGFGIGLQFGNNTWGNSITNTNIYACGTAVKFPYGIYNSGEVISFHGGALFNSTTAVHTTEGASLQFFGTAFDYCVGSTFVIDGGSEIGLYGCHIETSHIYQRDHHILELGPGWNRFSMHGGVIWMSNLQWDGTTYAGPVKPWLRNHGDMALFTGVRMSNILGEFFQTGDGHLVLRDNTSYRMKLPVRKPGWIPWLTPNV